MSLFRTFFLQRAVCPPAKRALGFSCGASQTSAARPRALGSGDMSDDTERTEAEQFHLWDWQLNDESTCLSLERVDEVFDELESILREAWA